MPEAFQNYNNQVELKTETLGNLLGLSIENGVIQKNELLPYNLSIPDYQRIYCWEEKNVTRLLDDIKDFSSRKYHLGSVIFHKKQNENIFNIVDGQQRIVTLALFLLELQPFVDTAILDATFESEEAQNYIAYNKWLIKNYVKNNELNNQLTNQIINNLQFSVLIINDDSLDLAYTFFSNQNSRGKALTDYDLLKAHHLRHIHIPEQAKHLAERWDSIVLSSDNDSTDNDLGRTFGICLFRLRKWMRRREWSNDEKFKVKTEFEAAPIIPDIPPFGEQFSFYESIQGGTHFFAYADHFIYKFKTFRKTNEYHELHRFLSNENHWWYRDVIEAFLFAYYLKFGTIYSTEALISISQLIANHRYSYSRSYLRTVLRFAGESEIIMMIDQATSPTFFLAELQYRIKVLPKPVDLNGTRKRFFDSLEGLKKEILKNYDSVISI